MKTMTETMKKTFLILIITTFATSSAWSQSLSTVRGKTKEGKTLHVTYYHGASEDYIETVKYQVVDDLQAKVTKLQNESKELQSRLDAANKRIKEASENANKSTNSQIEQLQNQISDYEAQIQQRNQDIEVLQHQLDSVLLKSDSDKQQLQQEIAVKEQHIVQLSKPNQVQKPTPSPVIGIEASIGLAVPVNCINESWNSTNKLCSQFDIYYGTKALTKAFPISVEGGVGLRMLSLSATKSAHTLNITAHDYDGFAYNALYYYSDLQENLHLTYFDIPIRVCIGQPIKNQITVYAKLGITPSILLKSDYQVNGTYSTKGYYPEWGLLLEDVEELGFENNQAFDSDGEQPDINKFVLWGNIALGANMPIGQLPIQVNAGVKFDYSLMSLGTAQESIALPEGKGLLPNGGNMFIPSFNIGFIYNLK